jgi:hypothetical protein
VLKLCYRGIEFEAVLIPLLELQFDQSVPLFFLSVESGFQLGRPRFIVSGGSSGEGECLVRFSGGSSGEGECLL